MSEGIKIKGEEKLERTLPVLRLLQEMDVSTRVRW
jgi:hypothetical protein